LAGEGISLTVSKTLDLARIHQYILYRMAFRFSRPILPQEGTMTTEKTTRELVYETNRDVKWICRTLQRMEARDEDFEARLRALEGWQAEKAGEERRVSTVSAGAGGVVGGVVAVLIRVFGGG
jgi:hypothetical protein